MGSGEELIAEPSEDRIPCQFCGRKFASEPLNKHIKVCEKTSSKKRKTFNSARQRIEGTELGEFVSIPSVTPPPVKKTESVPSKTARSLSVKVVTNKSNPDVPPPHPRSVAKLTSPSAKSSNNEKCQYCDRCFGPKSFDRHIEWCKEQSRRINATTAATREALERLEARTKYQAPLKSRRTVAKLSKSGADSIDSRNSDSSIRTENCSEITVKSNKPFPKDTALRGSYAPKEVNFIRQNVLRYSYRVRMPKKEKIMTSKSLRNTHEPRDEFQEIEDWITANGTKIQPSPLPSKISPSSSTLTCSTYDDYDPFLVAENQLKELFDDHPPEAAIHAPVKRYTNVNLSTAPVKENHRDKSHNKENISIDKRTPSKMRSNHISNTENGSEKHFKISPTSAFSKYSSRVGHENLIRVPLSSPYVKADKNDRYLSENTNDDREKCYSTNDAVVYDANINRYPLITLSNLSLCSSMSVDLPEDERKTSNIDRNTETPRPIPCDAMSETREKYNKSAAIKKNLNMERMLYGKEELKDTKSNGEEEEDTLNDYGGLLVNEQIDLTNSFNEYSCSDQDSYLGSSPETKLHRDSVVSKTGIDSAYNSLNRKSPVIFETHHHVNGNKNSSYGDGFMNSSMTDSFDEFQSNLKMSKFCHECGAKFLLAVAKYCYECGVRRLVI